MNNLTVKNCDKVEKFKKFKKIQNHLGQKFKNETTFQRSLNVIIKSKMSKMRTNTVNVKEFLGDTNKL